MTLLPIVWVDEPPERNNRWGDGRPWRGARKPALSEGRMIEVALIANAGRWALVDSVPATDDGFGGSAMYSRLWRDGFEVLARKYAGDYQVYARWTHGQPWEQAS